MTDYAKAILGLSITSVILYVMAFYFLFRPTKVRDIYLRLIEFWHKYKLQPWYEERKAMWNDKGYLPIIRLSGIIIIFPATICAYFFIYKIKHG